MQLESRPSGLEGPFACLGGLQNDGWVWLNSHGELSFLIDAVRQNLYMMAVLGVCDRSLLSGMINITVGDEAAADDGETLTVPSSVDESQASARSAMWGAWASEAALVEDAIGFFPSCGTPQAHEDEFMQAKPTVMNVHLLQFLHRIDVRGQHHWRVFTPITPWESPSDGGIPCEFPGLMELPYVKIIGDSLPGNNGEIYSKAKRIFAAEWQLYEHKKRLTMQADTQRSHPVLYQQYVEQKKDVMDQNGSHEVEQDQRLPESRDQAPDAMRTHAFVRHLNTHGGHCGEEMQQQQTRTKTGPSLPTVTIEQGKSYVNNHLPEAPAEMPVVRQAVIESICLAYGVPMSMLSSGDASGKAKLNTESAGPETARIFREAQADRKRRLESNIRAMYDHLYSTRHVAKYIKETTDKHVKKRYSKKRKADLTVEELEDDEDLNSILSSSELEKKARVRISIPTSTQGTEVLLMLMEKGVLKYSAGAYGLSRELGLSLRDFRSKRALNDEEKILEGVAPKPEAASKPKKKAKAK